MLAKADCDGMKQTVKETAGGLKTEEVESLLDVLFSCRLVDTDVSYVAEKREIDFVSTVFLVVVHKGNQLVVVVAGDGQRAVDVADVAYGLAHLVGGEARLYGTQV